jgi:cell division protein FtsW
MTLRERIAAWWPRSKRDLLAEFGERKEPSEGPDLWLVGAVLALTGFGIVMVFSAGAVFAAKTYGDWTYFLKREAVYAGVGLLAFFVGSRLDYSVYRKITYPLLFLSMLSLAAVLKLGPSINGAVRWFRLGPLSFQPSELAKFALALYLAVLLARKAEKVRDFSIGFLPPLLMTGVFLGLLLKQPDLGTAVIIGVTALGLMFVAGTRTSYILISVLIAAPIGWKVFITGESWRMKRLLAFLYPWQYRRNTGYQLYESLISVGSGGVWGQGLGQGHQKLFFLPEAHTDFILAVVGEELGLIGVLSVLACFLAAGVARVARLHARARRLWLLPGLWHHLPFRAANHRQHVRGAGPAADQGPALALCQLRRHGPGHEPVHGRRAGQHLGAHARAFAHDPVAIAAHGAQPVQEPAHRRA